MLYKDRTSNRNQVMKEYKKEIAKVFASITEPAEMERFIDEMLTSKEVNDLALRWQLLKGLYEGESQRAIAAKYGMSLCKITRGSKVLKGKGCVARTILETEK